MGAALHDRVRQHPSPSPSPSLSRRRRASTRAIALKFRATKVPTPPHANRPVPPHVHCHLILPCARFATCGTRTCVAMWRALFLAVYERHPIVVRCGGWVGDVPQQDKPIRLVQPSPREGCTARDTKPCPVPTHNYTRANANANANKTSMQITSSGARSARTNPKALPSNGARKSLAGSRA